MIYRFAAFELDTSRAELRRDGVAVPVEPQVYALLLLLLEHRDRLVSREELIEKIWEGRVISDAAVASRIKSARQAVADDGESQHVIRTLRGRGVRFVADVTVVSAIGRSNQLVDSTPGSGQQIASRPSIAVLPLMIVGDRHSAQAVIAEALPHELIAGLSTLRWLFVIERGSSFRFREAEPDVRQVGEALGVRYCLSGILELAVPRVIIGMELARTSDRQVIWSERYELPIDNIHEVRTRIVNKVINALEMYIPQHEARSAQMRVTEDLDAWASYHLGLSHMFRINRSDNQIAGQLFSRAIELDGQFARAHAGLSFVHFQNVFLRYVSDLEAEIRQARADAEQALLLDNTDPFANFIYGRSYWLKGDLPSSIPWFDRAITLCPSYAQGIYSRGFAQTLAGAGELGRADVDTALTLSPLDPLAYAMLGTRALTHVVDGAYAVAAQYGERAARAPGAHVMIAIIAVICHGFAGNQSDAMRWARNIRKRRPDVTQSDFFRSLPISDETLRLQIAQLLGRFGI
jgi:TolB-like protein